MHLNSMKVRVCNCAAPLTGWPGGLVVISASTLLTSARSSSKPSLLTRKAGDSYRLWDCMLSSSACAAPWSLSCRCITVEHSQYHNGNHNTANPKLERKVKITHILNKYACAGQVLAIWKLCSEQPCTICRTRCQSQAGTDLRTLKGIKDLTLYLIQLRF